MGAAKSKTVQVTLPSGNTYSGQMRGTKRQGKGLYRWTDGSFYEGDWVDNQQHGSGAQTFPNGNIYVGQFYRNNPNGQGRLTTFNGETIEGKWTFLGRADNIPNAHHEPVGRYRLEVAVTDQSSQSTQMYSGPATLHLASGMVVLPGMGDPKAKLMPFAVAIAVDSPQGNDSKFEKGEDFKGAAVATPVAMTATGGGGGGGVVGASAGTQSKTTVAFGVHDQALEPKQQPEPTPLNPLDPRIYF